MKKNYWLALLFFPWGCIISFNLGAQDTSSTQQPVPICVRIVENIPAYPGGQSALLKFINDNVQLPAVPTDQIQETRLVIQFIIEANGSVSSVKILRGIHPEIDVAYLRVFEEIPAWEPARQRGIPVRTQINFPIRIRFE